MDPLKKLAREEANKTLSFLIPWMLVFVVIAFIAMQAVAIRAEGNPEVARLIERMLALFLGGLIVGRILPRL